MTQYSKNFNRNLFTTKLICRNNNVTILRRNHFSELISLRELLLHGNAINAIEREIIDDAIDLRALYLEGNLCANGSFLQFNQNRSVHMQALETCFNNVTPDIPSMSPTQQDMARLWSFVLTSLMVFSMSFCYWSFSF